MTRPRVSLLAAVARNGVIGRDNALPWHIPGDLPRFKQLTMGQSLVMGRKTFDSIGRPLPGRTNLVVTRSRTWTHPGVEVAHGLDEALARVTTAEAFVIGGAEIYALALPHADRLLLTELESDFEGDTFFPPFDRALFKLADDEAHGPVPGFPHVWRYRTYLRAG